MPSFQSRNTIIVSAILFLLGVGLLRLSGGVIEDNVLRILTAVTNGQFKDIPLFDISSIKFEKLTSEHWNGEQMRRDINKWAHDVLDSILPAFIGTASFLTTSFVTFLKYNHARLVYMALWFV